MFWYIILLAVICFDFGLENLINNSKFISKKQKLNKLFNFIFKYRLISLIFIVFMATFKSISCGADVWLYADFYHALENKQNLFVTQIGHPLEKGYAMLTWICALLSLPFRAVPCVITIFVMFVVMLFINKFSKNKFMSLMLFVCLGMFAQTLNNYRQIVAVAFILLAIMALKDNRTLNACAFILFGCMFHITALVGLVLIVLAKIKPKLWIILSCLGVSVVGAFAFPYCLKVVEILTPLDYYTKYYVEITGFLNAGNIVDSLYTIGIVALFFMFYVFKLKILKLEEDESKQYDFFLLIFMLVAIIRIVGTIANIPQLLNRINMYFMIILIVLIPLFLKGLQQNKKLYIIANVGVWLIAFVYMIYLYQFRNSCCVVPFVFEF